MCFTEIETLNPLRNTYIEEVFRFSDWAATAGSVHFFCLVSFMTKHLRYIERESDDEWNSEQDV